MARAEGVRLSEATKPGEVVRYDLSLKFQGVMKVDRGGKPDSLPLETVARLQFDEQHSNDGRKGVRHYLSATSESIAGVDRSRRSLDPQRAGILTARSPEGTQHYAALAPLTREELELVSEHFDPFALAGLLPGKEIELGQTWPIGNEAAQMACQFDGLIQQELVGKLIELTATQAIFSISGKAEGIEAGATVKLSVAAKGTFDRATSRIVNVSWEQTDERGQGPISPAIEGKAVVTLTRSLQPQASAALQAVRWPTTDAVPELLTQLRYLDPQQRYEFVYGRDWHIVVQNPTHLVMRLLTKGEFVAQATIAEWKTSNPKADRNTTIKEFVEATAKQPNWVPEKVLENGPMPASVAGREVYRLVALGTQDGLSVVQAFHLVKNADDRYVVVTCLAKAEAIAKLGTRDLELVNAIEFTAKKP